MPYCGVSFIVYSIQLSLQHPSCDAGGFADVFSAGASPVIVRRPGRGRRCRCRSVFRWQQVATDDGAELCFKKGSGFLYCCIISCPCLQVVRVGHRIFKSCQHRCRTDSSADFAHPADTSAERDRHLLRQDCAQL